MRKNSKVLAAVRLPGEAGLIDRFMERVAHRYVAAQGPDQCKFASVGMDIIIIMSSVLDSFIHSFMIVDEITPFDWSQTQCMCSSSRL